ncbi:threonine synthase [Micromonospora sp. LOL_015]|uniref:threonine synthase n=1 Tax=Micromonospora sp. LOL_015 TaxID=3345416 RepID=UPI003A888C2D
MEHFSWRCSVCATDYGHREAIYTCQECTQEGKLDLVVDYEAAGRGRPPGDTVGGHPTTMWRYRCLLPVTAQQLAATGVADKLPIGWTPLHPAYRLGQQLGLPRLRIKNEASNLTGSLKDRASALVAQAAATMGAHTVATASSGNAAAALAGITAAIGLRTITFVPQRTPPAKIAQLQVFGANVVVVEGGYDTAVELCWQACREWGWYCRTTAVNPFTTEGKKTAALEILEQAGWRAPDAVVVAVGDGNIITGLHRGFLDAYRMGWVDRVPRLIGVQAATACAIYDAWRGGQSEVPPGAAETVADSIAVGRPQDGFRALRAVRDTGGAMVTVTDGEIRQAMVTVARGSGVFAEPAGAAAFAALPALVANGVMRATDDVVVVNTGSGLKAAEMVPQLLPAPSAAVAPRLKELAQELRARRLLTV